MTEKLFYKDPYLMDLNCHILEQFKEGNNYVVVLDKSPFYPKGGGQPSDLGRINGIDVLDVYEKENIIYHMVKEKIESENAQCHVDYERRFDHMQQHTGEHILTSLFDKFYNGINCGFHLGDEYTTIDINIPAVTEEMIEKLEEEANNIVYKNLPITTFFVDRSELDNMKVRSKVKVGGTIRIVDIHNVDLCACCGTHLTKTGEVGIIKISKTEKYKGMTRVYFKCGKRAVKDYQQKQKITSSLMKLLSVEEININIKVEQNEKRLSELNKEIINYKKSAIENEVKALIKNSKSNLIVKCYDNLSFDDIKLLPSCITEENILFIVGSDLDNKVIMTYKGDLDFNSGKIFKENILKFNGKGGGDKFTAQGAFRDTLDMRKFIDYISNLINN